MTPTEILRDELKALRTRTEVLVETANKLGHLPLALKATDSLTYINAAIYDAMAGRISLQTVVVELNNAHRAVLDAEVQLAAIIEADKAPR